MLTAITPIDGRYSDKVKELAPYFSEFALIKNRVLVEIEYFKFLCNVPLPQLKNIDAKILAQLDEVVASFDVNEAQKIKDIEKVTNHDVKAVEYYIKNKFDEYDLVKYKEFIHFGLTSQDINNTAFPLMIQSALEEVLLPMIKKIVSSLKEKASEYQGISMLARTHGQPASPTTLGKEFEVFIERLQDQLFLLENLPMKAKFGGATGNFNAHKVAYPNIDWISLSNEFIDKLGLIRSQKTTQIDHYDHLAAILHNVARINTILIDLCRDVWTYISMEYFKQKVVANEVGSSAMPHKVNPIDFENAEGNLGLSNAMLNFLAEKLPISRLQRDLTDSTVLRNIGIPFSYGLIAMKSIEKGLGKLVLNESKLKQDLDQNWAVVAEAIQTILRRENYPSPYEALKGLTRGNENIKQADIQFFIDHLDISDELKHELHCITPYNYVGYF